MERGSCRLRGEAGGGLAESKGTLIERILRIAHSAGIVRLRKGEC